MSVELPDCYKNLLRWTMKNGIIKAVPKKTLSYSAQDAITKAFKKAGGAFVSKDGEHYFELVLKTKVSCNSRIAQAYRECMSEGIFG